jgi:phi LC3 family holin
MRKETAMKINFKVRLKNKTFWLLFVPAVLLLVEVVASVFGFTLNLSPLGDKLKNVIEALFTVLAITGVVVDPTTSGVSDSTQAMSYETPKGE